MADNKLYKVAITLDGKYVHGKEYDKLVQVFYDEADGGDGCSYVSRKRNVNVRPGTDDTVWQKASDRGMQGEQGQVGSTGASAGFGAPTATISGGVGTPSVQITASGSDTAKVFNFAFSNLKGETGATGETGAIGPQGPAGVTSAVVSVDSTSGTPSASATVSEGVLSISFSGLKGDQGNSGYSGAAGELEVVNNDSDGGEGAAWSAERGKIIRQDLAQLEQEVGGIEDKLIVTDSIPVTYEYIDNIYVSTSSIAKQNGRRLYYVPVVANTIVKASWSFTNDYVRCGFSTAIPAKDVSVDKSVITVGGTGTGTKGATCSPSVNGYFCVSFDDPSSIQSLAFSKPTSGIGKEVKNLQDDLLNLVAFDGYVEGNDGTSVTTTIPLPVGRYKMTIRDYVRGMDNRSYIIFRIKVGSRTICEYMGQELVPDTFYFDVLSGETSAVILSRSVSGKSFGVRITASDKNGIFDYNPLDTEIDRLMNAKKELLTSDSPFVLLHFTDIHGNSENLTRVLQYYNTLRYRIDDIIHTGDAVANTVTATSFDFWDECGAEKVLNCIGNHDVWVTDDYTPPANFAYDIYFKPYIDNADWGAVVQPSDAEANGKCYYYKDYSNGIRLVVLDYREPAGQIAWFEQVLADAVTNELSVVAAVHYVPGWTTGYHNSFDISQFVDIVLNLSSGLVNAIDTFIGNGGEFVCWLTGHTHRDNAGYYQGTNGKQVVINLDTASVRNDGNTRYRAYNSKSQDCFNIISVNTGAKLLSIFRVGNDMDALQRHIGTMCIKYDTGELVWTN